MSSFADSGAERWYRAIQRDKWFLIGARGVNRRGEIVEFAVADLHMTYRHSDAPEDVIAATSLSSFVRLTTTPPTVTV